MNAKPTVLLVEDDESNRFVVQELLSEAGFEVSAVAEGEAALASLASSVPDILISDINLPGMDGFTLAKSVRDEVKLRYIPIILITAQTERDYLAKGFERGANDFLFKPFRKNELLARVHAALVTKQLYQEQHRLEMQNTALHRVLGDRSQFHEILGQSAAMQAVFATIEQVKDSDVSVLITGESGTGKELVARALHFAGPRASRPFFAQNCAAFQEQLLESELFGHVRGAFTGANRDKQGVFEAAEGGTLFLDEIGEMPLSLQAKLLRVLQDGSFHPVGSTKGKKVNVRIVAATNRSVEQLVKEGKFREDLLYRVNVVRIELPPLRKRVEDIPLLADRFLSSRACKEGKGEKTLSSSALAVLLKSEWPGNVRQLQNEISRAYLMSGARTEIEERDLSVATTEELASTQSNDGTLKGAIAELERSMICQALDATDGNKSEAARRLGISRSNLIAKVQEYALPDKE